MRNVGIIGGGIGGTAAAAALRQAGMRVCVYERAPELKEAGAGMMLWPNATRVLRRMGLLKAVAARSGRNRQFQVRAASGECLMEIALGRFEVPALCTPRTELLAVLASALPAGCLQLGRELEALEQDASGVVLRFRDGREARHDAVIGADGIRSRVRETVAGWRPPIYRGYTVWRGISAYRGRLIGPGCNSESWGRGSRFGILECGNGRFTWYATANGPAREAPPEDQRRRELLERFADWHAPIPELIASSQIVLENGAMDLGPLPRWTAGRVTLLGDAAHPCTPNLGQGGCMALEDAAVLASSLGSASSIEAAFQRYESRRRWRTRNMQLRSLVMGHIGQWQNAGAVAVREWVTSLLPAALFERNLRRDYAYEASL